MSSEASLVVWACRRANHIAAIRSVHWALRDAAEFGQTGLGGRDASSGELKLVSAAAALGPFRPLSLELEDSEVTAALLAALASASVPEEFLAAAEELRVSLAHLGPDDLLALAERMPRLAVLSYKDEGARSEGGLLRLLQALRGREAFAALDLRQALGDAFQLSAVYELCPAVLRLQGLQLSTLLGCPNKAERTELLCLRELERDVEVAAEEVLRRGVSEAFPALRCLVVDWAVVAEAVDADERGLEWARALGGLLRSARLRWLAVVAYVPMDEDRAQWDKLAEELRAASRGAPWRELFFAASASAAPNMGLGLLGAAEEDEAARRLVEVCVGEGKSSPGARDLLYVLRGSHRRLATPDLRLEFGGFDEAAVRHRLAQPSRNQQLQQLDQKISKAEASVSK